MRRVYTLLVIFTFILSMLPAPSVGACFNPSDMYSVEVLLNKPGLQYDVSIELPHEIEVGGKTFMLKVWNGSRGLHVRVEIPTVRHLGAYWTYSGAFVITSEALEKLRDLGWVVNESELRRGNATFKILSPGGECTSDSDCATGGCSGEVCGRKGEVEKIVTPCVYPLWYECFQLTSCGCVNGTCSWKPNPEFEKCLKSHGIDPSKVIRVGQAKIVGEAPDPEELGEAVKELLNVTGVNCTNFELYSRSQEGPAYNTSEVSAPDVVKRVLEELGERGVVKGLTKEDIEDIAKVAEWGNAGWNSHIGWYETKNGGYAWVPYDKSKDPQLVKCGGISTGWAGPPTQEGSSSTGGFNSGSEANVTHENQAAEPYEPKTNAGGVKTICGPGLITLLSLWALMIVRRRK